MLRTTCPDPSARGRRALSAIALLVLGAGACATTEVAQKVEPPPPSIDESLEELVESAFVRQALREAPQIVFDGVRRIGDDLPLHPDRARRIPAALRTHLNEPRLLAAMMQRLLTEEPEADLQAMAAALRTHPTRRRHRLGLMVSGPPPAALFRYLRELEEHPPSDARIDAIRRLERSYVGAELTVAMVAAPLVSVREVLAASVSTEEEAAMVRAMHRAALAEIGLERLTSEVVAAALIFAYRDVSDEELVRFADFYDSELGHRYHRRMVELYFDVLEEQTKAAIAEIRQGTEPPGEVLTL